MSIFVSAGDYSGDTYGGLLINAIKKERPDTTVNAIGGDHIRSAADFFLYDLVGVSLMGFLEPVKNIFLMKRLLSKASQTLAEKKISLLIVIDYYGFNIHLARNAAKLDIPVIYFVSPQIWATRYYRIHQIKKCIKKMFVIFPFEEAIYRKEGVPVEYIGHPLLQLIPEKKDGYNKNVEKITIGLMPGSRIGELNQHLPVLLETAKMLKDVFPNIGFQLFLSANSSDSMINHLIKNCRIDIEQVREKHYEKRSELTLAWSCSGTATIENAFLGIPTISFYRTKIINYFIAKMMVKVKYIAMPNIIADKKIMPELIQGNFNQRNLLNTTLEYLNNPEKLTQMKKDFSGIKKLFGAGDIYGNLAKKIVKEISIN
ncbi:MAG: lipid-A-disaccharide synthase [bacterium]